MRCTVSDGVAVLVGPHPEFTAEPLERQWGLAGTADAPGAAAATSGSTGSSGCGCGGQQAKEVSDEAKEERKRRGRIAADLHAAEEDRRRFWCEAEDVLSLSGSPGCLALASLLRSFVLTGRRWFRVVVSAQAGGSGGGEDTSEGGVNGAESPPHVWRAQGQAGDCQPGDINVTGHVTHALPRVLAAALRGCSLKSGNGMRSVPVQCCLRHAPGACCVVWDYPAALSGRFVGHTGWPKLPPLRHHASLAGESISPQVGSTSARSAGCSLERAREAACSWQTAPP